MISREESKNSEGGFDRESVKARLLDGQKKLKVREIEGEYKFDNPDLEEKSMSKRTR